MNIITNNDLKNNFIKIFFTNYSNKFDNIFNLFINEYVFENLLNKTLKMDYKSHKNSYNIYNYKELNFKIFSNKSSYCYKTINNSIINKDIINDKYYINILNYDENKNKYDDFPALKEYNNISYIQEIVFEIVENISLIFSNENNKLFIYLKIKKTDNINLNKINELINNLLN